MREIRNWEFSFNDDPYDAQDMAARKSDINVFCDLISKDFGEPDRSFAMKSRFSLSGDVYNYPGCPDGEWIKTSDVVKIRFVGTPCPENKRWLYEGRVESLYGAVIATTYSGSEYLIKLGDKSSLAGDQMRKYAFGDWQPVRPRRRCSSSDEARDKFVAQICPR